MKYNMKKVLTATVLAAVITGTASCGQQQSPAATSAPADTTVSAAETEGTANVTESEAGDTETEDVNEAQTDAGSIDPMSADYSKIDIEILPDSGEEIVNFTNDMLAGLYDGKIVKCTGRTSRRMTGNAMMQAQDDGTIWDTDYVMNFNTHKLAIRLERSYHEDSLRTDAKFSAPYFISLRRAFS